MNDSVEHQHTYRYAETVVIEANRPFAADTYRITLHAPGFVPLVQPGQFAMLRLPNSTDPLLGRPFAVYSADHASGLVEMIYLVVGRMTKRLAALKPGEEVELIGPLGNGWSVIGDDWDHLIMVAGGVGQTPFLMQTRNLAQQSDKKLTLLYGARSRSRLAPLDDFTPYGITIGIATEDGSCGTRGYVTDLIPGTLQSTGVSPERTVIAACGPRPMLQGVFRQARFHGVRCWTSLESPMSCGLGICFGCVVEYLTEDGTWDYRRTCQDGPVFDAYRLRW